MWAVSTSVNVVIKENQPANRGCLQTGNLLLVVFLMDSLSGDCETV